MSGKKNAPGAGIIDTRGDARRAKRAASEKTALAAVSEGAADDDDDSIDVDHDDI